MRKLTKLLIPALVLVAVVMAFSVMTVSAAEATQLEWTGGTVAEAVAFLDNAMKTAEAGNDVVVTLKADMAISYSAKTFAEVGTDATTDKVVTITGAVNGDTRYKLSVGTNANLVFKGNVVFADVALAGANSWHSNGAIGCVEGKLVVEDSVIMKPHTLDANNKITERSSEGLNVFGGNLELNAGAFYVVAGNTYKTGYAIKDPVITIQGNAVANTVIGRQQDLGGGCTVTGLVTVNILGNAHVNEVTAGSWQASATAGDAVLNMNTTGRVSNIYLAGNAGARNGEFKNGDKRSHYTLNVLGGNVYGLHLYAAESGSAKNLDATFNLGNATYNSMIWFGINEPQTALNKDGTEPNGRKYATAIINSSVEVNITGGTFMAEVYCGSHFEYAASAEPGGSYENVERVINVSGGTFNKAFSGGTYSKYSQNAPHRGNTVINITGGTFKNMVYGGSRLITSAGAHSGNIEMNISGGTYANHIFGGSYMGAATASQTGDVTLTIDGYIKQSGGRTMGGSISTAGDHKGEVKVILNNSGKACSFAYGIAGGSYLDGAKAQHTGSTEIIIKGSADWSTNIYCGSWSAFNETVACPEETPRTAKVIVDSSYTGEIGTIYAGSWYNTSTAVDKTTGKQLRNVKVSMDAAEYTVEVNGGLVSSIKGHSTSHAGNKTPGNTNITVNAGTVLSIEGYTNADTGSVITIIVKDTAERVCGVKGYTKAANLGDNVTLTYDRTVLGTNEIKNVKEANITATGDANAKPKPYDFTLYVANVSKGLGDGSSPENAMGHDADYYEEWNKAVWYIKENGGTNSKLPEPAATTVKNVYKKNALYKAMTYKGSRIQITGGTIVICDVLTIDSTDAMRFPKNGLGDFWCGNSGPANCNSGAVTITSIDPYTGEDYRWKGARLVLDGSTIGLCLNFNSPTTLDHLNIENRYNSVNGKSVDLLPVVAGMGNELTIGYDVFTWANDINPDEAKRVDLYPSIMGGHRYTNTNKDHYVTVGSGTWAAVVGGSWNIGHTGNATVAIDGSAKVTTVCGTVKPTSSNAKHNFDGSCWIGLWGGEVDNVYVVGKPGMIWGDASVGVGGTKINGKVYATHPDYAGDPVQGWAFNYTDAQLEEGKFVGFDNPVPETGSNLAVYAIVAAVSLLGSALVISFKKKSVED